MKLCHLATLLGLGLALWTTPILAQTDFKRLYRDTLAGRNETALWVGEAPNGDMWVLGRSAGAPGIGPPPPPGLPASPGASPPGDLLVMRLAPDGDIRWTKRWLGFIPDAREAGHLSLDGVVLADGNLVLAANVLDAGLMKLDSAGNVLWHRNYGQGIPAGLTQAGNGFLLALDRGPASRLVRTDASGNVLWSKSLAVPNGELHLSDLEPAGNEVVLAGWVTDSAGAPADALAMKLDASGNLLWAHAVDGQADDRATCILSRPGGGVLLAGQTHSFHPPDEPGNRDGFVYALEGGPSPELFFHFDHVFFGPNGARWVAFPERVWDMNLMSNGNALLAGSVDFFEGFVDALWLEVELDGSPQDFGRAGANVTDAGRMSGTAGGDFLFGGNELGQGNFDLAFYRRPSLDDLRPCLQNPGGETFRFVPRASPPNRTPNVQITDLPIGGAPPFRREEPSNIISPRRDFRFSVELDSLQCPGVPEGEVRINLESAPNPPYLYSVTPAPRSASARFQPDSIVDQLPAGTYAVAVKDASGCEEDTTVVIPPLDSLQLDVQPDSFRVCPGDPGGTPATFVATGGTPPYAVQLGDTSINAAQFTLPLFARDTLPWVLTDANACQDSGEISITEGPLITLPVIDSLNQAEGSTQLPPADPPGGQWLGPPSLMPGGTWNLSALPDTGRFNLVYEAGGCRDTTDAVVFLPPEPPPPPPEVLIPNVLTPNGDGINDEWQLRLPNVTSFQLVITNRWGEQVFQSNSPDDAWRPGSEDPAGVYFYRLRYELPGREEAIERSGSLTLTR